MTSASVTSSSVARNAAISMVGRSEMNPTVSDRMMRAPCGRSTARKRRIEGREQHVGGEDARPRHAVEQRRLAGVGVADQRHDRIRHAPAAVAVERARALDLGELGLDLGEALLDHAAVGLELGLAGAAEKAEAAALALEMGPGAHQPALLISQVRMFDLQRAFAGPRASAENFQDQPGAVDDLGVPGLLQIALLDRRKRAVHHHDAGLERSDQARDLLDLALAEERRGAQRAEHDDAGLRDVEIDGACEADRLVELFRRRSVRRHRVRARRAAAPAR